MNKQINISKLTVVICDVKVINGVSSTPSLVSSMTTLRGVSGVTSLGSGGIGSSVGGEGGDGGGVASFTGGGGFSRSSSIGVDISKDLIGVGSRFLIGVPSREDFLRGVLSREATSFSVFFRVSRVRDRDLERDRDDDRRLFYNTKKISFKGYVEGIANCTHMEAQLVY